MSIDDFTIDKVNLTIPGLDRVYTFLHFSDTHIAYAFSDESDEAKAFAVQQTDRWNEAGITPPDAFDTILDYANEINADALMIAGDCVDYHTTGCVKYVTDKLQSTGRELLYVRGNHELCAYFGHISSPAAYEHLMCGDNSLWVRDYGAFLVVGIDDSDKNIQPEQLEKLRELLGRNIPILLLMHIPVLQRDEIPGLDDYFLMGLESDPETTRQFCAMVRDPSNSIKAVFAGHIHFAAVTEPAPGRKQYISAPGFKKYVRVVMVTGE